MRVLHLADLHLDSPMRGMAVHDGAPQTATSCTREAFANAVRFALTERIDLVLIAGDVYDGDWQDFSTGIFFASQLSLLREADIPVIVIRGNHDAASVISRDLPLPDGTIVLSHDQPQSVALEHLGVAVHGQSFASREVEANLASNYPPALAGLQNIGLLHTSLAGHPDHDAYAPCSPDDLERLGYDYWALGHIHEPARVAEPALAHYPGCVQGRSVRECGPHGGLVVDFETGEQPHVQPVTFDVLRWAVGNVDCSELKTFDDMRTAANCCLNDMLALAGGRPLACRLRLVGESELHNRLLGEGERVRAELVALANDLAPEAIWLGAVQVNTSPVKTRERHLDAELQGTLEDVLGDAQTLAELRAMLAQVRTRVPETLIVERGPLAILEHDDAAIARALELARARLELVLDPPIEQAVP